MKYFFAVLTIALVLMVGLSQLPQTEISPVVKMHFAPAIETAVLRPKLLPKVRKSEIFESEFDQVSEKIAKLTEEVADIDHELQMLGYPQVMLEQSISEAERAHIVDKVLAASQKYNAISLLTLKKIDLQAGM